MISSSKQRLKYIGSDMLYSYTIKTGQIDVLFAFNLESKVSLDWKYFNILFLFVGSNILWQPIFPKKLFSRWIVCAGQFYARPIRGLLTSDLTNKTPPLSVTRSYSSDIVTWRENLIWPQTQENVLGWGGVQGQVEGSG